MIEFDKIPHDHVSVHPGQVLLQNYIKPLKLNLTELSRQLGLTRKDLDALIAGRLNVDGAIALMLALRFGTTVDYWLSIQATREISNLLLQKPSLWKLLKDSNVPGASLITNAEEMAEPFTESTMAHQIEDSMHGGSLLRIDLFKASMSQKSLAQALDLKPSQISRLIAGKQPISTEHARSFSKIFKRPAKRYLKQAKALQAVQV